MTEISLLTLFVAIASALPGNLPAYRGPPHVPHGGGDGDGYSNWDLAEFKTLVSFGDSYTDDSRLKYFGANGGQAPPPGWDNPPNNASASGGYTWTDYVAWYTGAKRYNYAVSGAECSDEITPRYLESIGANFPTVKEYEVPAWIADTQVIEPDGTKFFSGEAESTVYSMWIGTNDLGQAALLTDSQVLGTNITTYIDCVYSQLKRIYDNGARYFVLQNVIPLQLTPLYATPANGGVVDDHYWPTKPANVTEVSYRMMEQVATTNAVYKYRTPFELLVAKEMPEARVAVMDMYQLILDIYNNPTEYLNGTAPANVTSYNNHCTADGSQCVQSTSPDSFLWYDELHPSEQTDRIIARNFVDVVHGESKYATYWSS
ncbi:carbohydrate esterase family 16 protein [Polychaeton citri CBS 116435]|uniref:Carbohydrate esterase family 16 protein n=1 Tax=Polychaeton citri CBS 116435 TaxID=1314669 RepID=A0A9P4QGA4_9PEZI|nr:carbohydrate esterase family 16 protein [Polychaeton citri CBS 116435]